MNQANVSQVVHVFTPYLIEVTFSGNRVHLSGGGHQQDGSIPRSGRYVDVDGDKVLVAANGKEYAIYNYLLRA